MHAWPVVLKLISFPAKMVMARKMEMAREMTMEMERAKRNGDIETKELTVLKDMFSCANIMTERKTLQH
jgi:hypothetical protein